MHLRLRKPGPVSAALAFLTVFMLAALASGLAEARAAGSWFIDEARFHASAHGVLSCADCHERQAEEEHPRADKLNQAASTSFDRALCLQCHAAVEDAFARGVHGGKPVMKGQNYARCVACHNPHYVPGAHARARGLTRQSRMPVPCNVCHEARAALPEPPSETAACLSCHGLKNGGAAGAFAAGATVFARGKAPQGPAMCLACHGPEAGGSAPRISAQGMGLMTHGDMNCLLCHTQAARFPHNRQERVNCLACHTRHDEKTIHDAHSRVRCGSCHLSGVSPVLKDDSVDFIVKAGALNVHHMTLEPGTASCARCHSPTAAAGGGKVGAANDVLPPKSVLCMGCHAASFSVQDAPGRLGLGVFVAGFALMGLFWLSSAGLGDATTGKRPDAAAGGAEQTCGRSSPGQRRSRENRWLALCREVLLQRRLYRESRTRWTVHALIFFPFLFRCAWGMLGLLGSLWAPAAAWPWLMLAKDWSATAFLYDVSGLALLLGLLLAVRLEKKPASNAPGHSGAALWLLLAITLTGFALEGMRIALTGMPDGSGHAFMGYALAQGFAALSPAALARIYGWGWYLHAMVTAAAVACIPFSRLRHMFVTPIFLLVQTLRGRH